MIKVISLSSGLLKILLYKAITSVYSRGEKVDEYSTTFGIRTIELIAEKGSSSMENCVKFRSLHHYDLGPLGSAVNEAALRRQLTILKEMGCDAIRIITCQLQNWGACVTKWDS